MKQITGILKDSRNGIRKAIKEMDDTLEKKEVLKTIDSVFVQVFEKSVEIKKNELLVPKQQVTKISNGFTKMLNHLYSIEAAFNDAHNYNNQMALLEGREDREEALEKKQVSPTIQGSNNSELVDYLSKALPQASEKLKKFTDSLEKIKIPSGGMSLPGYESKGGKTSKVGRIFAAIPKPAKIALGVGVAVSAGVIGYNAAINKNKKDALREGREEGTGFVGKLEQSVNSSMQAVAESFGFMPEGVGETGSAKEAISFFVSRGWTKEQAAGIVGNLQAESGPHLKTNSFNSAGGGKGAYGIAQWRGIRQDNFSKVFNKPIRQSTLNEQLAYVDWELKNSHKNAGNALRNASSARDAAVIVDRLYEISGGETRNKRIANATALLGEGKSQAFAGGAAMAAFEAANFMMPDMFKNMSGAMISPVGNARISSPFGMRVHPTQGVKAFHKGVDYAAPMGTPVKSVDNGIVMSSGPAGAAGNLVTIKHQNGIVTKYMHLSSIGVSQGQMVRQGQLIGSVGSTGRSTGPHLHFQVEIGEKPVNPLQYVGKAPSEMDPSKTFAATEPGMEAGPKSAKAKNNVAAINNTALKAYTTKSSKPRYVLLNPNNNTTVVVAGKQQTKKKAGSNPNPASQYKNYLS